MHCKARKNILLFIYKEIYTALFEALISEGLGCFVVGNDKYLAGGILGCTIINNLLRSVFSLLQVKR